MTRTRHDDNFVLICFSFASAFTLSFDHFDSLHSRVCCFEELQALILTERLYVVLQDSYIYGGTAAYNQGFRMDAKCALNS
ncbi:hypothetical protein C5167_036607 [Papaver somniferum]|uniref:Uncharacterized protein n=1 Tax=Papaver somniferum TaxID=3469 RepID=A0A4Y7I7Q2_PAPSO|nr:hypothetical protein C5167_036607 [Papaver somniferum]